ncbi:hypervirulence associated TUDOR domain-containing protein [Aquimarina sp. M1]
MIRKGSKVKWKWGQGTAQGKVIETYVNTVTKTIKGNKVTRNGEESNKALYIEQEDGDHVLKSENEVTRLDE